jgi:hypothetical protein
MSSSPKHQGSPKASAAASSATPQNFHPLASALHRASIHRNPSQTNILKAQHARKLAKAEKADAEKKEANAEKAAHKAKKDALRKKKQNVGTRRRAEASRAAASHASHGGRRSRNTRRSRK